jgi:hypothetical protein
VPVDSGSGELWDRVTFGQARRRRRLTRPVRWDDAQRPVRDRSGAKGLSGVLGAALALLAVVGFAGRSGTSTSPPHGSFAFQDHQQGTPSVPVMWNSCKPIHVVVNDALAPPRAGTS